MNNEALLDLIKRFRFIQVIILFVSGLYISSTIKIVHY